MCSVQRGYPRATNAFETFQTTAFTHQIVLVLQHLCKLSDGLVHLPIDSSDPSKPRDTQCS